METLRKPKHTSVIKTGSVSTLRSEVMMTMIAHHFFKIYHVLSTRFLELNGTHSLNLLNDIKK